MCDSTKFDKPFPESGELKYPFTDDCFFKLLMQRNSEALHSLICGVLRLDPSSVTEMILENPILIGEAETEKDYILDLKVKLGSETIINIEMQVCNYHDWPERSMQYLCRCFDMLNKGEDYNQTKTAVHIGLLDFSLFTDNNKLFSSFRMMDVETHRVYTEKFQLYTICLPLYEQAAEADKAYKIDDWARFFKAKTWEEIKELSETNEVLYRTAITAAEICTDSKAREIIERREDQLRRERTNALQAQQLIEERELKKKALQEKEKALQEKEKALQEKEKALQEKEEALSQKEEEHKKRIRAEAKLVELRKQLDIYEKAHGGKMQ